MRFTVQQQDLNRGLAMVSRAVPNRTTRPILTNICFATDGERLRLFATDEEIGVVCWIPAVIHEEGTTAIPAALLHSFIGNLQPGFVDFALKVGENAAHTISVRSQRSHANIRGFDASEYPLVPTSEGSEPLVQLDAVQLKAMIGEVIDAAGHDIAHPVFTGVLVQVKNRRLSLVAADRQRLAVRRAELPVAAGERKDILIPAASMAELARILPAQGKVDMAVTPRGSQVIFRTEQFQLSSRLLEGAFPNYEQFIPSEHVTRAVVATKAFADALKEVLPFAEGGNKVVVFTLTGGSSESLAAGALSLQATAQDLGDGTTTIQATVDGPDQQVNYWIRYLVDALEVIKTPEVSIELSSERAAGLIKPVGAIDFQYVITPLTKNAATAPAPEGEAAAAS